MREARVGLLTGPIGVGKTSVAERVIGLARRRGLDCDGLLAPPVLNNRGQKVGIWAVNVGSGERRRLARTDRDLGGPSIGPYSFDAESLSWALGAIEAALGCCDPEARLSSRRGLPRAACGHVAPLRTGRRCATDGGEQSHGLGSDSRTCDLLLVDEIGRLELEQGIGLAPILPRLAAGEARRALVLVRESLLAKLQDRLGSVDQVVFQVNEENRDTLPAQIVERLI